MVLYNAGTGWRYAGGVLDMVLGLRLKRGHVFAAITLLYFVTQLLTFRLGIIPADEGFSAITPLRLLQGQRP
jgi:hypothetical protein